MSRICGPIFGAFALLATVVTAAEPANDTSSAAPAFAGSSVIQPVSLNVLAKSLKPDDAKKDEVATTVKEESKTASKTDGSAKSMPGDEAKSDKKPTVLKPLKRRVIVVKTTWCGACQALNNEWPKLRKVRWRIGIADTDHFQLVDADQVPGVVSRYGVTQLPTILLIENGKVIDRAGALNAKDLAEFYYGRL